jgi:hypothetical protein|tara:strand:+ start:1220 stop:1366 length:147 start_codon:yes stop_codon:yes gene_type:complete
MDSAFPRPVRFFIDKLMILHTGHLAIETHGSVIAEKMLELLEGKIKHQ